MIQANVAAAETLEDKTHSTRLSRARSALEHGEAQRRCREFLCDGRRCRCRRAGQTMRAGSISMASLPRRRAVATEHESLINEVRPALASTGRIYALGQYGHFGLNLRRYAHFTSPIRRYADLIVHRALVRALGLGPGGLPDMRIEELTEIATSISGSERRAMAAERETIDRLIAGFLADRIGATFQARISGVTRSGLFVKLSETGADGFVPAATMGDEYFRHDEARAALIGTRSGKAYRMGDTAEVRLLEVAPMAGALRFELISEGRTLGKTGPTGLRKGRDKAPSRKAPTKGASRRH